MHEFESFENPEAFFEIANEPFSDSLKFARDISAILYNNTALNGMIRNY